jgi:hypothetical protein
MLDKKAFPKHNGNNCRKTSDSDNKYNCIAWAYGENSKWFWPAKRYEWPENVTRENTIEAFMELFSSINYCLCDNQLFEPGYEKVAIYVLNGEPKHAARQLTTGKWTSKIGQNIDIEHDSPEVLDGPLYGSATIFMKRKIE